MNVRFPHIQVILDHDLPNFVIIKRVVEELKRNNISEQEIAEYRALATLCNYDDLIYLTLTWVSPSSNSYIEHNGD